MDSSPAASCALPPTMITLPSAAGRLVWEHEISSSSDDSEPDRRHGRTQSLAPGSPYTTSQHSRNNSSVSFTLSPRSSSPNRAYSPFSAASERDSFLPQPPSSPSYRTPSPSIQAELSRFFADHSPLAPTSKRGRAQWLLLLGIPAILLIIFLAVGTTLERFEALNENWEGFREHLGEGLKGSNDWGHSVRESAKRPSWKAEVNEMDKLIKEARVMDRDTIEISMAPIPRTPDEGEVKYLGYLPHSGKCGAWRWPRHRRTLIFAILRLP